MDYTNVKCISNQCKDNDVVMHGAGGSFGGRVNHAKVHCPVCGLTLLLIPMRSEYEYSVSATTEEERKEQHIQKAKDASALELAKTINRINETGF